MTKLPYRKKLIEVALPLEAINKASAREKSIRHGHLDPASVVGAAAHAWWGIVRIEAAVDMTAENAVELADRSAVMLQRYASVQHKDLRAPQNLYPIAALERELRRRLGDPAYVDRRLRMEAG